ncbi:MAG: metallophosphoesterase [Pseudomonadales bacterium]
MMVTRRAFLKSAIAVGTGVIAGTGLHGYQYARRALELTRATVPVRGLSTGLNGLTIGLLTDVHRSQWVSDEDVRAATDLLMTAHPDLIVLGGDYVSFADRRYMRAAAEALSRLTAPHGVFAVLGNHDDDREMPAALQAQGVEVLRDVRTRRTIRGEHLELAGIRFWTRRATDISAVLRGTRGPVVLLAHDPRRIAEASALSVPVVLSGHTHGGQVVLPIAGAIAARKFRTLAGLAEQDGTTLFVSRGVGTVYVPVRLNCPPEVAVLTLRPADA